MRAAKSTILLAVALAFAAGPASAQSGRGGGGGGAAAGGGVPNALQGFSVNRDKPVHIEAASLEVRDKQKQATFTGNVQVVQGDTTLRCKVLVVHYDNEESKGTTKTTMKAASPGPGGSQQISRLEAQGGVVVIQKDQTATGDSGLFDMKSNTITLTGNVIVSQGKNIVRGDRLVVDMTTGVSRVDAGGSGGPVRMLIEQKDGDGKAKGQPFKFPGAR